MAKDMRGDYKFLNLASGVCYLDASKILSVVANASGFLTNNGSGTLTYTSQISLTAQVSGVLPSGNLPTNVVYTDNTQTISGTKTFTAPVYFGTNAYLNKSGDNNSIHLSVGNNTAGLLPNSTTTANNASLGLSSYRWRSVYTGGLDSTGPIVTNTTDAVHVSLYNQTNVVSQTSSQNSIRFRFNAATLTNLEYAGVGASIYSNGDATYDGQLNFHVASAGALTNIFYLRPTGLIPRVTTTYDLGSASLAWANVHGANLIASSVIRNLSFTGSKALVSDASDNIVESSVTSTELGYVSGVTSSIQTQFTNKRSNLSSVSGARWQGTPLIGGDGVMEVGKFVDFHDSNADTSDFTYRLTASGNVLSASGYLKSEILAGVTIRPAVILADGTLQTQDIATFRSTIGAEASHPSTNIADGNLGYSHIKFASITITAGESNLRNAIRWRFQGYEVGSSSGVSAIVEFTVRRTSANAIEVLTGNVMNVGGSKLPAVFIRSNDNITFDFYIAGDGVGFDTYYNIYEEFRLLMGTSSNVTYSNTGVTSIPAYTYAWTFSETSYSKPEFINQTASYRFVTDTEKTTWNGMMPTASYPDLVAIEALAGTSGFLKKTATNTWALDTTTYVNKAGDTNIGSLSGANGSVLVFNKDVTPSTADNTNYSSAPIYVQRVAVSGNTAAAGIGFHNSGVNAAFLYYDPAASVFKYNRHLAGSLVTLWDSSNLTNLNQLTNGPGYLTSNQTITLSGEASGSGTTAISVTLSNSAVIGKVLTGYAVGTNTAIAATDSILGAFQKLQGQVNARLSANQTITLSGIVTGSGTTAITTAIADGALSIAKTSGLQTALNGKSDTTHIHTSIGSIGASPTDATAPDSWSPTAGLYFSNVYNQGYPSSYGNILSMRSTGGNQIFTGWAGVNAGSETMWFRNKRDAFNGWSAWQRVLDTVTDASAISNWNTAYNRVIVSNLAVDTFQGNDADTWVTRMTNRANHFGRYDNSGNGSPRYLNYVMLRETAATVYGILGYSSDGEWYVSKAAYNSEISSYYKVWTSNNFTPGNQTITLSGEASGSGTTSIAVTLNNASVIGKVLTGYAVGSNTAIAASDSILSAFQKLQGQVNARLTGNQTITLSGVVTGSGTTAITTAIADNALSIAKTSGLQTALNGKLGVSAKAADSDLLDGIDVSRFVYGDNGSKTTNLGSFDTPLYSGFFDANSATDSPAASTWTHMLQSAHSADPTNWRWQLAANFEAGNVEEYYTRIRIGSGWKAWRKIWTTKDISQTNVANWSQAYSNSHSHSNKANLDTINQNLGTSSSPSFNQLFVTSGGTGQSVRIGDDAWLGDCDWANVVQLKGTGDATKGYLRFGNDSNGIGYNGTYLTYTGTVRFGADVYAATPGLYTPFVFDVTNAGGWGGILVANSTTTNNATIELRTLSNTNSGWAIQKRDESTYGTPIGCFTIEDTSASAAVTRFPITVVAGNSGSILLNRNVDIYSGKRLTVVKDVDPSSGSEPWTEAPIQITRAATSNLDVTNVAGLSFHNAGVNAALLYYSPAEHVFKYRRSNNGPIHTIWDTSSFDPNSKQDKIYKTVFEAFYGSGTVTAGWCRLGTYTGNSSSRFVFTITGKQGWNDQDYCSQAILHGGTNFISSDTGQIASGCKWNELYGSGPTASAIKLVRQSGYPSNKFDLYILNDVNYVNWTVEVTAYGGIWNTSVAFNQADPGSGTGVFQPTRCTVWDNGSLSNPMTGSGTATYIPKFSNSNTLTNSLLSEDGTNVFQQSGYFSVLNVSATASAFVLRTTADTVGRFVIDASGKASWGPGGSTGRDTNLYRASANYLVSDHTIKAVGGFRSTGYTTGPLTGDGPGIEIHYDSANTRARVLGYNRTASTRIELALDGSPINFYANGSVAGSFSATGVFNLVSLTASRVVVTDASKNLVSSAVTTTELGYVSGVTSAIQTQINGKVATNPWNSQSIAIAAGASAYFAGSQVGDMCVRFGDSTKVVRLGVFDGGSGTNSASIWYDKNGAGAGGTFTVTGAAQFNNTVTIGSSNSQVLFIGDDASLGDCNVAHTMRIRSASNAALGYWRFGGTSSSEGGSIGWDGSRLVSEKLHYFQEGLLLGGPLNLGSQTLTQGGAYAMSISRYENSGANIYRSTLGFNDNAVGTPGLHVEFNGSYSMNIGFNIGTNAWDPVFSAASTELSSRVRHKMKMIALDSQFKSTYTSSASIPAGTGYATLSSTTACSLTLPSGTEGDILCLMCYGAPSTGTHKIFPQSGGSIYMTDGSGSEYICGPVGSPTHICLLSMGLFVFACAGGNTWFALSSPR